MASPIKHSKVLGRIEKGSDLELTLRLTKADGLELVNLRDYIPSQKQYGRGILFDVKHISEVIRQLQALELSLMSTAMEKSS